MHKKMNMSNIGNASAEPSRRNLEFGVSHVVEPEGTHLATVVWLHGLMDDGQSVSQRMRSVLPHPNIKLICPTAPTRTVQRYPGLPLRAWFDAEELEDAPTEAERLNNSAEHIAKLLSQEPNNDIQIGIGGSDVGGALALFFATSFASGKYANFPHKLNAVVCLGGWLPGARSLLTWETKFNFDFVLRAGCVGVLICHGKNDETVSYKHGEEAAGVMSHIGFKKLEHKVYSGVGDYMVPETAILVREWLTLNLKLERGAISSSMATPIPCPF